MPDECIIRPARAAEAGSLSELALRSKGFWGYSQEFLEACRRELSVDAQYMSKHPVMVIENSAEPVGFYSLERMSDTEVELGLLFVLPGSIGRGFGRQLIEHAKQLATESGYTSMLIQGDPNAASFYHAAGGEPAGMSPSGSIPGRMLPLFRITLNSRSTTIDEPLADSAMLAHEWSKSLCKSNAPDHNCGWYHGSWQILRLLGVFNSIRSDDDFFLSALDSAIAGGANRFLISGAADYALLARIAAAARKHDVTPQVTVVDHCETPLKLNRWYAERTGLEIETLCTDILEFRAPGRYDVTCTHSFLCFFDSEGRKKLAATWWDCLYPGGAVLTAQRARPNDNNPRIGYTPGQVAELGKRARGLAEDTYEKLGIDPDFACALAEGYASHHWTHLIQRAEELRELFESQGFGFEHFAPPGKGQFETDTPGTPNESDTARWRILARKP